MICYSYGDLFYWLLLIGLGYAALFYGMLHVLERWGFIAKTPRDPE